MRRSARSASRASRRRRAATTRGRRARRRASPRRRAPATPGRRASPCRLGRQTSASTVSRSGSTDHSSSSSRVERQHRVLADLDRAAGAERPAPGPARHPGGAAAGEPAALGVARRRTARPATRTRPRATRRSAQRIGCRSMRSPSRCARSPRAARRARRGTASRDRASAAIACVGGGAALGRRARTARRSSTARPGRTARVRGRGCRGRRTRDTEGNPSADRRRKHWGWGFEDEQPSGDELRRPRPGSPPTSASARPSSRRPRPWRSPRRARRFPRTCAPRSRGRPRACAARARARPTATSCGRSAGASPHPPDVVALPRVRGGSCACSSGAPARGWRSMPYGGGTSVVGGVDAGARRPRRARVASTSRALDRVLEVDAVSRAARDRRRAPPGRGSRSSSPRTG